MLFDISFITLSFIALKWAYNKNKQNERIAKVNSKAERLHKQFIQAKKWAEEI